MLEDLTERERDLILLALMKMGGDYVELTHLVQRLASKDVVLCLRTDARRERRDKGVPRVRAVT